MLFQHRLPAYDLVEFQLQLLLIQRLPAGDPIDARADFRQPRFVESLHLGFMFRHFGARVPLKRH